MMKRKAEGIALLSVYNDEDEDEEEDGGGQEREDDGSTGIVDYGHDEAAEAGTRYSLTEEEDAALPAAPSQHDHQVLQQLKEDVDEGVLADFLPSPPHSKCSDELQDKFTWFLSLKEAGRSFNEELRNSKGYRNPDFLHRAVIHQGVDQLGSCFNKEIFDPHGYDQQDFYDALAQEQKREFDRREMERQQNQKLEFVRANTMAAAKVMQQKAMLSLNESTGAKPEGRVNKKSKWDKVEPGNICAPLNAQNALAAALVSANAAALNFAQAAQQPHHATSYPAPQAEGRGKSARKQ